MAGGKALALGANSSVARGAEGTDDGAKGDEGVGCGVEDVAETEVVGAGRLGDT